MRTKNRQNFGKHCLQQVILTKDVQEVSADSRIKTNVRVQCNDRLEIVMFDKKLSEITMIDQDNFCKEFRAGDRVFVETREEPGEDPHERRTKRNGAVCSLTSTVQKETARQEKRIERVSCRDFAVFRDTFARLADLCSDKYSAVCAVVLRALSPVKSRGLDYFFTLLLADETATINLKVFVHDLASVQKMLLLRPETVPNDHDHTVPFEDLYRPGDVLEIRNIKHSGREKTAILHKSSKMLRLGNIWSSRRSGSGSSTSQNGSATNQTGCGEEGDSGKSQGVVRGIESTAGNGAALAASDNQVAKSAKGDNGSDSYHRRHRRSSKVRSEEMMRDSAIVAYFADFFRNVDPSRPAAPRDVLKVEDVRIGQFFDIVAKVLFMEQGMPATVCLIDYTCNAGLAQSRRQGKYDLGMLLYVKVYGEHALSLRKTQVGKVLLFRNLRMVSMERCLMAYLSEGKFGRIEEVADTERVLEIEERERLYLGERNMMAKACSVTSGSDDKDVAVKCERRTSRRARKEERRESELFVTKISETVDTGGLFLIRALLKRSGGTFAAICDGIDIMWATVHTSKNAGSKEESRWVWALVLVKDSNGTQNFLMDWTEDESVARAWSEMIRKSK